jgi:hypothetical protein
VLFSICIERSFHAIGTTSKLYKVCRKEAAPGVVSQYLKGAILSTDPRPEWTCPSQPAIKSGGSPAAKVVSATISKRVVCRHEIWYETTVHHKPPFFQELLGIGTIDQSPVGLSIVSIPFHSCVFKKSLTHAGISIHGTLVNGAPRKVDRSGVRNNKNATDRSKAAIAVMFDFIQERGSSMMADALIIP